MAVPLLLHGQSLFTVAGRIVDEAGEPMVGAHALLGERAAVADSKGEFVFDKIPPGSYNLHCRFIGYAPVDTTIHVSASLHVEIRLDEQVAALHEVVIEDTAPGKLNTLKTEKADRDFIMRNYSGSLAQSLESLAGLNAMAIGAASSKPVVRGLGFNRVAVAENNIKQEGQQWGADHGLEIDPFHIEEIQIIKGAASIEYGSDAIGGVINLDNSNLPEDGALEGDLTLLAKSVNHTLGGSLSLNGRKDRYYFKIRGSALDYADYHIPTDQIIYLNTFIPVYNQRLKNTAGHEKNINLTLGYVSPNVRSSFSVSNVNQKSGFFPGSHGAPDIERVRDDGSRRNIGFPYQYANHFKITTNHILLLGQGDLHIDAGLQKNRRQERSEFHTHYSGQRPPEVNPDLELDFGLSTLTLNLKYHRDLAASLHVDFGVQGQWQENEAGGYSFFLPAYHRNMLGVFAKSHWKISDKLALTGGARFDRGNMHIRGFYDPLLAQYLSERGETAEQDAWRSLPSTNRYDDFSGLIGLTYQPIPKLKTALNIGKSFRLPSAIELGANGIHHGSFRHEKGESSLAPERGYYLDGSIEAEWPAFNLSASPYLYYFTNYIFLNPSGQWSDLPHAGQEYQYTQSKALHAGVELAMHATAGQFTGKANLEYIANRQVTGAAQTNYPLPFTPPVNGFWEITYSPAMESAVFSEPSVFINGRSALAQNQVARNEKRTPGYHVFGVGIQSVVTLLGAKTEVALQAQNLFDAAYFNHISFYRQLEIPEPGRNIQLMIRIPFAF